MSAVIETDAQGGTICRIEYDTAPMVRAFIEDSTFCTGYFGPLGCGKTTGGVFKDWLFGQAWPGARVAVIRDTWPNLRDTTQKTFFEWFPDGVAGHYERTRRTFWLKTEDKPAEIIFRAMKDREDMANVLSLDLAAAHLDEPQGGLELRPGAEGTRLVSAAGMDHDLFKGLVGRLGRQKAYPAMIWMTGNPPPPSHWISKEFSYAGQGAPKNPRDKYRLYLGTQDTNRHNLRAGYYDDLEELFGVGTPMARRFLLGLWIEFAQLNPFRRDAIFYWGGQGEPPLPPRELLYIVISVDPAISKRDTAARTAITVLGRPVRGTYRDTIFVLRMDAGHWSPYEQAERILKLVQEWRPRKLRIEDVAWQSALKDIVQKEAEVKGIRLPMIDLAKPVGDKLIRASRISPLVESARILLGPGQRELEDAMLAVPADSMMWDPVDSLELGVGGFPIAKPEKSQLRDAEPQPIERRVRSYAIKTTPNVAPDRNAQVQHVGPTPHRRAPSRIADRHRRARGYAVRV